MSLTFDLHRNPTPASDERRAAIHANPGFGVFFTDHMLRAVWTKAGGWGEGRVEPYGPITLMPSAAVLHYAQEVFEGLKAYRHADGSVWSFRPEANAERMQRSAIPNDAIIAMGLASPLPAMSGAEPCTGSYMALRFWVFGLISPSGAARRARRAPSATPSPPVSDRPSAGSLSRVAPSLPFRKGPRVP